MQGKGENCLKNKWIKHCGNVEERECDQLRGGGTAEERSLEEEAVDLGLKGVRHIVIDIKKDI